MNAQDVMALTISTTIFRSGPASKFKALGQNAVGVSSSARRESPAVLGGFYCGETHELAE